MATKSATFTGTSQYSADFTQIINRAVAIASLPISQLNNQKNAMSSQSSAIKSMQDQFGKLGGAITNLGSSLGAKTLEGTADDSSILKPTINSGALPGTYTVNVISAGSRTQTLSKDSLAVVSDPYTQSISTSSTFTLTVNGVDTAISPATNNLGDLAKAINSSGAGVVANIINIGGSASPDYRISLQSAKLGAVAVALNDGSQNVLDTLTTGTLASYTINGLPTRPIESDLRRVTVGLGVTVDMIRSGTATVTVQQTGDSIEEALKGFVLSFNDAAGEIDKHHGADAGALKGNSLLSSLTQELRNITTFNSGSGVFARLADIGITADKNGRLQFDSEMFQSASANGIQGILTMLGSESATGFLKTAAAVMNRLHDASTGFFPGALDRLTKQISRQDDLIAENQDRVDLMRDTLTAKMAVADALIAGLEQQATFFNTMFSAQLNAKNG